MNTRLLLFAAILTPILELAFLARVSALIGPTTALSLMVLSSALGWAIIRDKGISTLRNALDPQKAPDRAVIESGVTILGGLLLLIPGFLSDLLSIPCFWEPTRQRLVTSVLKRLETLARRAGSPFKDTYIEGEFRREPTNKP